VSEKYDALLVVSFGGPERRDDVIPFLENVLRGKPVPRERMLEVAEHYYHFDGISPINSQVRQLITALHAELDRRQIDLPIYWGNRNWHPLLPDTIRQMAGDGVQRALAFMTSAYSSYSGCRQYRENVEAARADVGPQAPIVDKIRVFYNHPDFIAATAAQVRDALQRVSGSAQIAFTAHSIPYSMADRCNYARQLQETCRLVAQELELPAERYSLVYQSRSGRPTDPWLEPDILDHLRSLHALGTRSVVIAPIGFLSDHIEILFDLDTEAQQLCDSLGIECARAATVGTHPTFIEMIGELIQERLDPQFPRRSLGTDGPSHDVCPADCCLYTPAVRPGRPSQSAPS